MAAGHSPRLAQSGLSALVRDNSGSVLVLFALSLVVLLAAIGMGVDYARAMHAQTKLNAVADAAVLVAVSKEGMDASPKEAEARAMRFFVTQARTLEHQGVSIDYASPANLSVKVEEIVDKAVARRASIAFRGYSANVFSRILGVDRLTLHGEARASTAAAPNTDFFVLLDTSPSMLLPADAENVRLMVAATGGCAFACHETSNPRSNYQIARSKNITLRTDVVTASVQRLMTIAKNASFENGATYRAGIYDFDHIFRRVWPRYADADGQWVDGDLERVRGHVADAQVLAYCRNAERLCGVPDADTATDFTAALQGMDAIMPKAGQGTNSHGDTPRAVLLLITDGMRDEWDDQLGRVMGPMPVHLCENLKKRGIQIAVLNTAYLPESASDEWSIINIRTPFLAPVDRIGPALQACASPGLYHQVRIDDDLSSSVSQLFQKAIQTARIDQ